LMNIDVDFGYYLGMKNKLLETTKMTIIPITFGASINIIHGGKFVPFAGGGGGFYLMKAKPEVGDSVSYNKAGIYFGGGIKYFFTDKIALNVNPKFHVVFTDVSKTMFMTIGGGISYAVM
jgi:opacity protein-like surface antigen